MLLKQPPQTDCRSLCDVKAYKLGAFVELGTKLEERLEFVRLLKRQADENAPALTIRRVVSVIL